MGTGGTMHATALAKQNEFLKGYISRLQRQLEEYLGSFLPPPSTTSEREAEQVAPWIADSASLSPLLEAYDRRIAEADAAYESLNSQQTAIQARVRQLTAENERLMAEVKQLTAMALSHAEEGEGGLLGADASSAKVLELEEKVALLTSENGLLVDECKVLRDEAGRHQVQHNTSMQQLMELREQNAALRNRAASQELQDSQGAAAARIALEEAERKSSHSDRLRMELDAAEREVKVLTDELDKARHEIRMFDNQVTDLRTRSKEVAEQHQGEQSKMTRELSHAKEAQQAAAANLVKLKYENEDLRARAEEDRKESERVKKHQQELSNQVRQLEQHLIESRAREETMKESMRRFEEDKDELQLAADQATALKDQAQREISRLSDRLQQVPPRPPLPAVDDDAGYTAEPAAKEDEGEPQYNALREFNEQWRLQLDQKAQLAREEQEVLRTAAAEDIKKMYVENESNREQRQAANRQSEQKFLEDMESQLEVASENPWQRVTSLVRQKGKPCRLDRTVSRPQGRGV